MAQVAGAAALPGGAGQRGSDRLYRTDVDVGDHQPHARQAAGDQVAQERKPTGPILAACDLRAENLRCPLALTAPSSAYPCFT
ncbi:hypothetical protein GCM10010106_14550 [Thermopolyspora flexuosa]|nr:hypothetical protein GCM10010106_14550 [Thermopolyspora flexuosa]